MFAAERLVVVRSRLFFVFFFACSSCKLILEEGTLQHPHGAEKERNELGKLQVLSDVKPFLISSSRGRQRPGWGPG